MRGAVSKLLIPIVLRIGDIIRSDKIILRIYKAHPALPGEFPGIREKLDVLSRRAGIRVPLIYITELPLPGSFIIGRYLDETVLVFPKRFIKAMKPDQIEAMLAYNLVQVDNNIKLRTFVAMTASLMTMTASIVRWGTVFTGFGDYNDPAPKLFGTFVMGLATPPAAAMVQSTAKQDYDARAAKLCMSHDALILAIEVLEKNNVVTNPSIGFLCLVDPQKDTFFEYLFDTHLSLEARIKNLITEKGIV